MTLRMAALAALVALPAAASDLVVFEWSGYEDPEFHPAFIEKHGGSPTFAFFADEEEAFQKLRAGFRADISHPCAQSVPKWDAAGLLRPLDPARLENWDRLFPALRDLPGFWKDGAPLIAPFDWGHTAVIHRTDLIDPAELTSLRAFADPRYAGRISMPENVDDAFALAFLATGVSDWTTATEADLEAAIAFLREVHPNVRAYWTDGSMLAQLLGSGEVALGWGWNEAAFALASEGTPVAFRRDMEEGASTWVCGFVHLTGGQADEALVYDYINAALEERVAEHLVTAWAYGHANGAAMADLDPDMLAEMGFDDVSAFKAGTLFQAPMDNALRERMIAAWERIKAGF